MVNSNSSAFQFSEKIGVIIGKGIRYMVIGGAIIFLGRNFGSSRPSQPAPNPNPPAPSP